MINNVILFLLDSTGWQTVKVPANSMRPVSISDRIQPAAHISMALV